MSLLTKWLTGKYMFTVARKKLIVPGKKKCYDMNSQRKRDIEDWN